MAQVHALSSETLWFGLRMHQIRRSSYIWVLPGGETAAHFNWSPGEPNNGANACGSMPKDRGGKWSDDPCDKLLPFACDVKIGSGSGTTTAATSGGSRAPGAHAVPPRTLSSNPVRRALPAFGRRPQRACL